MTYTKLLKLCLASLTVENMIYHTITTAIMLVNNQQLMKFQRLFYRGPAFLCWLF